MADDRFKKKKTTRGTGRGKDASVDEEEGSQMQVAADPQKRKGKPPTRRLTRRGRPTDEDATPTVAQPPPGKENASAQQPAPPVPAPAHVAKFADWAIEMGVKGLADMFNKELIHALPPTKPAPAFEANPDKNRYQDVVCLEETRVKLVKENPTDTDYINANWVKFKDHDRTYIATQGPLDSTIEDFWRMVWQEQSPIVVNLTRCCEDGKAKCGKYWPDDKEGAYKQFGRFTVTMKKVEIEDQGRLTIYVLEVLPEGCSNSLIVRMLHTTAWPDGHVMHSSLAVPRLIRSIFKVFKVSSGASGGWCGRNSDDKEGAYKQGPVVIHCSAGIGRTGTLVLVDYILYAIFTAKQVSLKEAFLQLRSQRASSIQRESQFIFAVVAIMGYIGFRHTQYNESWRKMESVFNARNSGSNNEK